MIRLQCSGCGKALAVKEELAGKLIACPGCKNRIRVSASVAASEGITEAPGLMSPSSTPAGTNPRPVAPPPLPVPLSESVQEPGSALRQPPLPMRDDWDEDEEIEPRPRVKPRKKKRRKKSKFSFDDLSPDAKVFISVPIIAIFLALISLLIPSFIILAMGFCALVMILSGLWLLLIAYEESIMHVVACLFIPFYSLYYLISRFDLTKRPFFLNLIGLGSLFLVMCMGGAINAITQPFRQPGPDFVAQNTSDPGIPPPNFGGDPGIPPPPKPGSEVIPTPPTPPPASDLGSAQPGLRAYWSFDEGEGDTARDSGPHGLRAVLYGCQWVPGVRGKALQFNGSTDYVYLGYDKALNFVDQAPFTVAAWVKTANRKGYILSFRHTPDTMDLLGVFLKDGKLAVWARHRGYPGLPETITTMNPINDDQWHHFAVTRAFNGEVSLYLDGTFQGKSKVPKHSSGKFVTNLRTLGVESENMDGKNKRVDQSRLQGCLDELYIFGDTLRGAEIQKLIKLD